MPSLLRGKILSVVLAALGMNDVPHFHGIRHQSGAAGQQAEGGILSIATIGAGGY